jgi:NAD(P)H dehydrogenase (quinone)
MTVSTYAVTGASGHLGHLIVEGLVDAGAAPEDVVAVVRTPTKVADLAARGVQVRVGDYNEPATLATALTDVDTLVLVSGSEVGQRLPQHTAIIDAAKAAGVSHIIYTSIVHADTSESVLAPEHKATEGLLRASGVPYTILRNSWYIENYTRQLASYLERGILGAGRDGRISAAARADYAAAAVAVATGEGHENTVYELGGTAFTLAELAATITEVTGTPVTYTDVTPAELAAALEGAGLPAATASFVAALDEGVARGDLDVSDADLVRLIGRKSTPLAEAISAAKV